MSEEDLRVLTLVRSLVSGRVPELQPLVAYLEATIDRVAELEGQVASMERPRHRRVQRAYFKRRSPQPTLPG